MGFIIALAFLFVVVVALFVAFIFFYRKLLNIRDRLEHLVESLKKGTH